MSYCKIHRYKRLKFSLLVHYLKDCFISYILTICDLPFIPYNIPGGAHEVKPSFLHNPGYGPVLEFMALEKHDYIFLSKSHFKNDLQYILFYKIRIPRQFFFIYFISFVCLKSQNAVCNPILTDTTPTVNLPLFLLKKPYTN